MMILTARRPYRLTLSIYGATEESYDGMTRRRGSFRRFMRGRPTGKENFNPCRSPWLSGLECRSFVIEFEVA